VPPALALRFAPTPAEKAAGIDPSDPDTWPEGYRGPGIERARAGQPDRAAKARGTNAIDAALYAPTASEKAAGIDPNRPESWPENYRGPGIERALREGGGLGPEAPAAAAAPPREND